MEKQSSTQQRQKKFYPTPQNLIRIERELYFPDGTRRDKHKSINSLINKALDAFFKANKGGTTL